MRKPTNLKFGHRLIKIKYISHELAQKRKIMAEVDSDTNVMEIDKSLDHATTLNCIIHEMFHIIASHYCWEVPASTEEMFCETATNGICDLISQNPKLVEYLANSLKK